jgi:hypothetical protein
MRLLLAIALCVSWSGCKKEEPKVEVSDKLADRLKGEGEKLAKALTDEANKEAGKAVKEGNAAVGEAAKAVDQAKDLADVAKDVGGAMTLTEGKMGEDGKEEVKEGVFSAKCVNGGCTQICKKGRPCDLTCSGGRCKQTCEKESECELSCSGGSCKQTSEEATKAKITCSGGGCTQVCKGACEKTCTGLRCD